MGDLNRCMKFKKKKKSGIVSLELYSGLLQPQTRSVLMVSIGAVIKTALNKVSFLNQKYKYLPMW